MGFLRFTSICIISPPTCLMIFVPEESSTGRDGSPRLYVWDYDRNTKYRIHAAGYRSSYRGEDGCFAELPWDRIQDIDRYEYRRNTR